MCGNVYTGSREVHIHCIHITVVDFPNYSTQVEPIHTCGSYKYVLLGAIGEIFELCTELCNLV
jgi:hypothetical protein